MKKPIRHYQSRLLNSAFLVSVAFSFILLQPFSTVSQPNASRPQLAPGQTGTLLPDGRWLLVGGEGPGGAPLATVSIWDPRTGSTTPLANELQNRRAWHSSTTLPDGSILIFGGVASSGRVVDVAELFLPQTQTFRILASTGLTARSSHSATLLTDGRLLIVGGVDDGGKLLDQAEIWNFEDRSAVTLPAKLNTSRQNHTATLMQDGNVILWAGADKDGTSLNGGEVFDPTSQQFTLQSELIIPYSDSPELAASLPADTSTRVPIDSMIVLRFSKPLRVETVNADTISLIGPKGIERIKVVPAEEGLLAFITPETDLLPGAAYNVSINGPVDRDNLLFPLSGISFTTEPSAISPQQPPTSTEPPGLQPETRDSKPETSGADDDEKWKGEWRDGQPYSKWQDLPPLRAPLGVTALAGQVLMLNGEPLANVTLHIQGMYGSAKITTKTDETGRFLLAHIMPGLRQLLIDGRSANRPGRTYGVFEVGLEIKEGETNVLSFTIWMPRIDTQHGVKIPSPTTEEVVVTTPKIHGLEVRLPPQTVIRDHEGNIATEISITPIPLDRPPFPLPKGVEVPLYFTIQPGAAHIYGSHGARIIYPNHTEELPGTRFNFWHYDPKQKGWYIYGLGTLTEDRKRIVPDPGVGIYRFTGAMVGPPSLAPPEGPKPCSEKCGDPVDLFTGLFIHEKADLTLPDTIPIVLTRTYRTRDTRIRASGVGASHSYEMFLVGDLTAFTYIELVLPDGGRVRYNRISGSFWDDGVFEHSATPSRFYKSTIRWNGTAWDLKLKDGTVYTFPEGFNAPRPGLVGVIVIKDRNGNTLSIARDGWGNITRITSPNGRWMEFTYEGTGPRITQVRDNIGRTVTYTYDGSGRLWKV